MTTTAAAAGSWMLGDLAVNRMGFGAMRLAGAQSGVPGDRAQAIRVLRRAIELGVNHIDTAAFYFSPSRSANELNRYGLEASAADHLLLDLCGTQGIAFVPFFAIAGPAGLDPAPRPARARHPRHRRPRAPDRKYRCGRPAPVTAGDQFPGRDPATLLPASQRPGEREVILRERQQDSPDGESVSSTSMSSTTPAQSANPGRLGAGRNVGRAPHRARFADYSQGAAHARGSGGRRPAGVRAGRLLRSPGC